MTPMKRKKVYTIRDLQEIAKALGGRISIQIIPRELVRPVSAVPRAEGPR